jgi:hypothetical protein
MNAADAFFGIFGMTRVEEEPLKLTTTIDCQLISKANAREHRRVRDQRIIKERDATNVALKYQTGRPDVVLMHDQGARVTLSRPYHETPLDDDNIRAAFKAVRDAIAEFLGVDDGEDRLHWIYQQTKAARTGVRQSKPGWKKVKDKETGEVTRARKVVKNVAAYDTRPTITIEVMPVGDIDPQVKRVRELEAETKALKECLHRLAADAVVIFGVSVKHDAIQEARRLLGMVTT